MAIKPILFNTEMVRAILDGRKVCTRRIVKGYIPKDAQFGYTAFTPDGAISCRGLFETTGRPGYGEKFFKLPYQPGDILYVRETWKKAPNGYYYYEDWQRNDIADVTKWKPSIRMPKEAARIWLKVTDVRVERLQKCGEGWCLDIEKEGIVTPQSPMLYVSDNEYHDALRAEFQKLWDSTIKKPDLDRYGWDANPWVWVIEFERCEKPENL